MFLGVDVAKATLDVALIKDQKEPRHRVLANTAGRGRHCGTCRCRAQSQPRQPRADHGLRAEPTLAHQSG